MLNRAQKLGNTLPDFFVIVVKFFNKSLVFFGIFRNSSVEDKLLCFFILTVSDVCPVSGPCSYRSHAKARSELLIKLFVKHVYRRLGKLCRICFIQQSNGSKDKAGHNIFGEINSFFGVVPFGGFGVNESMAAEKVAELFAAVSDCAVKGKAANLSVSVFCKIGKNETAAKAFSDKGDLFGSRCGKNVFNIYIKLICNLPRVESPIVPEVVIKQPVNAVLSLVRVHVSLIDSVLLICNPGII